MDRDEALKLLRGGPEGLTEWNRRRAVYEEIPSLSRADLSHANLIRADLAHADLSNGNLCNAHLSHAFLSYSNLSKANLCDGDLRDAYLDGANLTQADLKDADLWRANLVGASLISANLRGTNLELANLTGADLRHTDLINANLLNSKLSGANFWRAMVGSTIFACDLSQAIGLDEIKHAGSSAFVDVNSILRFKDDPPEEFLRGCGLREEEIAYFRSVLGKPIRFYSCFISYSTGDEDFATRLHNDFQAAGIRCWKWDHDARTGRSLWGEIDQAIRIHDKLVLIASESSLKSPAVNREIERAIRQEDERGCDVLFSVRVDDYIFKSWEHERKVDVTKKVIANAGNWANPKVYKAVLDKLIRDLKSDS